MDRMDEKVILLIADKRDDSIIEKLIIEKRPQYRIVSTPNLQSAMLMLNKEPFDIILLDLISSYSAEKEIIQQISEQKIPLIVLSNMEFDQNNQFLSDLVAEATIVKADLTAAYLVHVIDEAIKIFRCESALNHQKEQMGQFAYAVSHDLQEPLRMVSSYLQLIERRYKDILDNDGREFIGFAVDGAGRMREMINRLLSFSRVESRGGVFERVSLNGVIDRVKDILISHQQQLLIDKEELPEIEGDEAQMIMLFEELLKNASVFNKNSIPKVTITSKHTANGVRICLSDNGIGMESKDVERIFGIFTRLHTREEYPGFGMGLPISRRIVERHGGRIWAESEPGIGSTFCIEFNLPKE
jgi:light-regulated signal transduction histidine kinase (bacteriophytochrome)